MAKTPKELNTNNASSAPITPKKKENYRNLKDSTDANTLINHHRLVQAYYRERNQKIATAMSYVSGQQWTPLQLQKMARDNKAPIIFDYIKTSYRTVLGMTTGNRYDIEFAPRESNDQKISDVLKAWYSYNAYQNDFQKHDLEALMTAWTGGVGYIETYIEVTPGKRPIIQCQVLNPLCIYPDITSRDVGSRSDQNFIDRVLWMSKEDLELLSPKTDFSKLDNVQATAAYKTTPKNIDMDHEIMDTKDGIFKVIERLYKVKIPQYFQFNDSMDKVQVSQEDYNNMGPDDKEQIYIDPVEKLYCAVVCPAWSINEYIMNKEYHCNPRNSRTQKIIFPIQEIVAESLNGQINGFVEHMISPQTLINAAMTQLYHQMQHAASASYAIDKTKFASEDEAQRFSKDHTKADEVFMLAEDAQINQAIQLVPKNTGVTSDNATVLNNALNALREISSTPLSLQGQQDNSTTSGIQNQQKIQQATTQLAGLLGNFKNFYRRRADIMLAYLYEYKEQFRDEVFRVLEKNPQDPNAPTHMTMMETAPQNDQYGDWSGEMQMLNDPTIYDYDIDVTDSFYSPSELEKIQQQIVQLFTMGVTANDPVMQSFLLLEFFKTLNVPQSVKDNITAHSQAVQSQQQAGNAQGNQQTQLDQHGQMMDNMQQADQLTNQTAQQAVNGPPAAPPPQQPPIPGR